MERVLLRQEMVMSMIKLVTVPPTHNAERMLGIKGHCITFDAPEATRAPQKLVERLNISYVSQCVNVIIIGNKTLCGFWKATLTTGPAANKLHKDLDLTIDIDHVVNWLQVLKALNPLFVDVEIPVITNELRSLVANLPTQLMENTCVTTDIGSMITEAVSSDNVAKKISSAGMKTQFTRLYYAKILTIPTGVQKT